MKVYYGRRKVRRALGDAAPTGFNFTLNPSSFIYGELDRLRSSNCLAEANASSAVKTIDDKTMDLAKNWQPTGFYTVAEVSSIVTSILASTAQARVSLANAPNTTSDAEQVIKQAHAYLDRNVERAKVYQDAMAKAQAAGATAIDAPGLKDWVIKSMVNISHAFTTTAILACYSNWLYTAANVVTSIWTTAKRIAGIAIKVGDTVLKAADDVLDLYPIIKWGALGVGAFFVLRELRRRW